MSDRYTRIPELWVHSRRPSAFPLEYKEMMKRSFKEVRESKAQKRREKGYQLVSLSKGSFAPSHGHLWAPTHNKTARINSDAGHPGWMSGPRLCTVKQSWCRWFKSGSWNTVLIWPPKTDLPMKNDNSWDHIRNLEDITFSKLFKPLYTSCLKKTTKASHTTSRCQQQWHKYSDILWWEIMTSSPPPMNYLNWIQRSLHWGLLFECKHKI